MSRPPLPSNLDIQGTTAQLCCANVVESSSLTGNFYWPPECSWQAALFDFDFDNDATHLGWLELLPLACGMWERITAGSSQSHIDTATLRAHGPLALDVGPSLWERRLPAELGWHLELAAATLPHLPSRRLLWSQYATLLAQRVACDAFHRCSDGDCEDASSWAPVCGWSRWRAQGRACDCLAIIAANTARLFAAAAPRPLGLPPPPADADTNAAADAAARDSSSVVAQFFALGGLVADPNRHAGHIKPLRARGAAGAEWARFLLFVPQHDAELADVEHNVRFGELQRDVCRQGPDLSPASYYTLSLASYTLSLASYTLALASYTLSLASYTLSLASYTLLSS